MEDLGRELGTPYVFALTRRVTDARGIARPPADLLALLALPEFSNRKSLSDILRSMLPNELSTMLHGRENALIAKVVPPNAKISATIASTVLRAMNPTAGQIPDHVKTIFVCGDPKPEFSNARTVSINGNATRDAACNSSKTERTLYLDVGNSVPLELLPFFRMRSSPTGADNACYFFNRVEKEGIRWVSYYLEAKPEEVVPDDALVKVLGDLQPRSPRPDQHERRHCTFRLRQL